MENSQGYIYRRLQETVTVLEGNALPSAFALFIVQVCARRTSLVACVLIHVSRGDTIHAINRIQSGTIIAIDYLRLCDCSVYHTQVFIIIALSRMIGFLLKPVSIACSNNSGVFERSRA